MKERLINALKSFGYPVFLQGTLNPEEAYPDSFITFWLDYTTDKSHYDNTVTAIDWEFTVSFYSNSAGLVNTMPQKINAKMREAGFIPRGVGKDAYSDEPTHTGIALDFIISEEM